MRVKPRKKKEKKEAKLDKPDLKKNGSAGPALNQ